MQAWEERYYEREEARNEGLEQGIKAIVKDYMEEGFDKDKIIKKLQKRFTLSGGKAEEYYEKFSKEN